MLLSMFQVCPGLATVNNHFDYLKLETLIYLETKLFSNISNIYPPGKLMRIPKGLV